MKNMSNCLVLSPIFIPHFFCENIMQSKTRFWFVVKFFLIYNHWMFFLFFYDDDQGFWVSELNSLPFLY